MFSWLDAKISLNYLYPVSERVILVFCCQINHGHSWPHKNYPGEQLTLLVSRWPVLKALHTFTKIYYGSGIDLLDLFIDFSHISLFTMLFQAFLVIWRWTLYQLSQARDQPSLSASSSVPSATPYLGFHPFDMCFLNRQEFILNLFLFFVKYSWIKGYYSCYWQQFGKKKAGWEYPIGFLICTGL